MSFSGRNNAKISNRPSGGGNKLQGLTSTTDKRSSSIRAIQNRSWGENRNIVFCMNQLGGIGRHKSQFNTSADGILDCEPTEGGTGDGGGNNPVPNPDDPIPFHFFIEMDKYYETAALGGTPAMPTGGQSYTIVNSQINASKKVAVTFGGDNASGQQGTSESICYFLIYIVSKYILAREAGIGQGPTLDNIVLLIKYAINNILELAIQGSLNPPPIGSPSYSHLHNPYPPNDPENEDKPVILSQVLFPAWSFTAASGKLDAILVWSAQDSNQEILKGLLRLWLYEHEDGELIKYTSTGLLDDADMAPGKGGDRRVWDNPLNLKLAESDNLTVTIKKLCVQLCWNILGGEADPGGPPIVANGNFAGDAVWNGGSLFFGSGCINQPDASTPPGSLVNGTSIGPGGELWADYVNYSLYVYILQFFDKNGIIPGTTLIKDISDLENTPATITMPSLISTHEALKNYIDWIVDITDPSSNISVSAGSDAGFATFGRLSYQVTELLILYNKGDKFINMDSTSVINLFDTLLDNSGNFYHSSLIKIIENMIKSEIRSRKIDALPWLSGLSITQNGGYSLADLHNVISQQAHYIGDGPYDSGTNTYTLNSNNVGGYYRFSSYFISKEIANLSFDPINDIIFAKGIADFNTSITFTDRGASLNISAVNTTGIIIADDKYYYNLNGEFGVAGYAPVLTYDSSGGIDTIGPIQWGLPGGGSPPSGLNLKLLGTSGSAPAPGVTILTPPGQHYGEGETRYFENLTWNDLFDNSNGIPGNIIKQINEWRTDASWVALPQGYSKYFQNLTQDPGSYIPPGPSLDTTSVTWIANTASYFTWNIFSLHRANYLLYSKI